MRLAVNVASDAETRRAAAGCPRSARTSCCGFVLENDNCYAIDRPDWASAGIPNPGERRRLDSQRCLAALHSIVMPWEADLFLKVLPFQEIGNLEKQKSPKDAAIL